MSLCATLLVAVLSQAPSTSSPSQAPPAVGSTAERPPAEAGEGQAPARTQGSPASESAAGEAEPEDGAKEQAVDPQVQELTAELGAAQEERDEALLRLEERTGQLQALQAEVAAQTDRTAAEDRAQLITRASRAQAEPLLRELYALLEEGSTDVGPYLEEAERLLSAAGEPLGPSTSPHQGALTALHQARQWLATDDLFDAREEVRQALNALAPDDR